MLMLSCDDFRIVKLFFCISIAGTTDSGWMNSTAFYQYISNILHPFLIDNKIELPVVLFVDGHTSHIFLKTSQFCRENGIVLIALLPNCTHIIQPMDVAVFKPLKTAWCKAVRKWKQENDSSNFPKEYFCSLMDKILKEQIKPEWFVSGFRACGLFPFNAVR